jgi:hypothetical protein
MMAGACGEAQSDRWSDLGVWEPDGVVRHGWARHDEAGIIHLSPTASSMAKSLGSMSFRRWAGTRSLPTYTV